VRLLPDYLEHRLDPATEARVAEHVATCESCRSQAEAFKATLALVANDQVPPMPVSEDRFLQEIRRRVRQQSTGAVGQPSPAVRWIPVFATTAVLVIAVGLLWQMRSPQPVQTASGWQDELFSAAETDVIDPIDGDSTGAEALVAAEESSFDGIETELVESSDVDDLIDDLAPAEQDELLKELELAYGVKSS